MGRQGPPFTNSEKDTWANARAETRQHLRGQARHSTAAGDCQQRDQGPDPMHNSHRECGEERGEEEESTRQAVATPTEVKLEVAACAKCAPPPPHMGQAESEKLTGDTVRLDGFTPRPDFRPRDPKSSLGGGPSGRCNRQTPAAAASTESHCFSSVCRRWAKPPGLPPDVERASLHRFPAASLDVRTLQPK